MTFVADLHIHSRFSMATSKALTIPHLAGWALRKGIDVLGTGDFTHPQWMRELKASLKEDSASGLFRSVLPPELPGPVPADRHPLFCLQTEINCIYKRGGKTRKVHNLIFMPDFEAAEKFSARLQLIGNLASDGRPILKLDSHDLLEIALACSEQAVLIPAHIWTPWYALFGSKSGFDDIRDCYADLTGHIFALETGLSSDPSMNRLLSALDSYALISNSDAHSGANLGREANLFSGTPSYTGIFDALRAAGRRQDPGQNNCRFLGTLEFYPEEGKYHLDGHRACNVVLTPSETRELNNICPACGKHLTVGVLHRVTDLADRETAPELTMEPETRMLIPLHEVIAQILGCNTGTRKVEAACGRVVAELGAELNVLCQMPIEQISAFCEPLGEAVSRIRRKDVQLNAGFDGQYGKISIFKPGELGDIRI